MATGPGDDLNKRTQEMLFKEINILENQHCYVTYTVITISTIVKTMLFEQYLDQRLPSCNSSYLSITCQFSERCTNLQVSSHSISYMTSSQVKIDFMHELFYQSILIPYCHNHRD
jgi:hypothetical protein